MAKVEFHFDFGSPNAYLAHQVIPQIEARTGAKFEYVPILLGGVFKLTNNRSPAEKMAGIKNRLEYERLELQRFVQRHGVVFNWNPFFPVNTLLIMRGAVATKLDGKFERYVNEVFRHMWAEPKDMDDPAVIAAALTASGFDAAALFARTQDAEVKDRLLKNTENSVARGTFGSPTFFVGDQIFFGKDRLRDVEERNSAYQIAGACIGKRTAERYFRRNGVVLSGISGETLDPRYPTRPDVSSSGSAGNRARSAVWIGTFVRHRRGVGESRHGRLRHSHRPRRAGRSLPARCRGPQDAHRHPRGRIVPGRTGATGGPALSGRRVCP